MIRRFRGALVVSRRCRGVAALVAVLVVVLGLVACGAVGGDPSGAESSTTGTVTLPGTNRPSVTIGDKNYPEQFLLGELYDEALTAQGYQVTLNPNIGTTAVSFQALTSGSLAMYPEYIDVWDSSVAGNQTAFGSERRALEAGRAYARAHGMELLRPTPFSDIDGVAVTRAYAVAHRLRSLTKLHRVASELTFGAPTQFLQSATGLPAIERAYGFTPKATTPLDIGAQYQALTAGTVQAAYMTTTDGELAGRTFRILKDPRHIFGWGNVVPVIPVKVLDAEGPDFAATIDRIDRLLTLKVMRRLNAAVQLGQQEPEAVAKQFLQQHSLVPTTS